MKPLIIIALALSALFASTFLLLTTTGLVTLGEIEDALSAASEVHAAYVFGAVALLLFADLFIAVPTLTIAILAGYFLGFMVGGLAAVLGMLMAGMSGYSICRTYGPGLLLKLLRDPEKLIQMRETFSKQGVALLLICRAAPILPEVTCCLAGATKMPFWRFTFCYGVATIPYGFIAAYAGSQSTLANPKPAIIVAVTVTLLSWLAWYIFLRRTRRQPLAHARFPPPQNNV